MVCYRLSSLGDLPSYPLETKGLSRPELTHCWTEGYNASFIIPLLHEGQLIKQIIFQDSFALISQDNSQIINVKLNNIFVGSYLYNILNPKHTIVVTIPNDFSEDTAIISFEIPNACPVSIYDSRILGVAFNVIELVTDNEIKQQEDAIRHYQMQQANERNQQMEQLSNTLNEVMTRNLRMFQTTRLW